MIGRRLGSYTVVRILGQGASGVVWEAEQDAPHRRVALKILKSGGYENRARFEREAEVLGWLSHPSVAQLYEAGYAQDEDGVEHGFLAMELVEGPSLRDAMADASWSRSQRVDLLVQLCDAVHHAHQKGVLHRDLKPSNVLLTADRLPKVVDFGIAGILAPGAADTPETRSDELLGTLPYIAPEALLNGAELDSRADVYSLGVIAYELLSGRLPIDFAGADLPSALARAIEGKPRSLGSVDANLAGDLEAIVAKALEEDPARRYATAADLAADLGRFSRQEPVLARPQTTRYQLEKYARRHPLLTACAVAVLVLLVGGATVSTVLLLQARDAGLVAEQRRLDAVASEGKARVSRLEAEDRTARARRAESERADAIERARLALAQARDEERTTERTVSFLEELLEASQPANARGRRVLAAEILERGARRLAEEEDATVRERVGAALERARGRLE